MGHHVLHCLAVLLACHTVHAQLDNWFMQFNPFMQQYYNPFAFVGMYPPIGGDPCANPFSPQSQYHSCSQYYKIQTNPLSYANARGLLRENEGVSVDVEQPAAIVDGSDANLDLSANSAVAGVRAPSSATTSRRRRRSLRRQRY